MKTEQQIKNQLAVLRGEKKALQNWLEIEKDKARQLKYADELAETEKQINALEWVLK